MKEQKKKVPDLRFKGFTDDWEQHKLGKVTDISGRIGFRGYTRSDIVDKRTGILTLSPTNIISNKLVLTGDDTYITKEKYNESPEIKLKNGYLLFVKTGSTLGKSALIKNLLQPATINPQLIVIKPRKINESFVSAILINDNIQRQVSASKVGGAVPTLTESEIKNFTFNIPNKIEQQSIGKIIENIDILITLQQRKLALLKQLKKGLLQKIFADKGSKRPILRFSGFTDDWEQCKLGDISEKTYSGLSSKSKEDFGHGHARYITYLNVHDNAVADPEGTDKVEIDSKQNNVIQGDLLFTVSSEVPEEVALNSVWPIDSKNIYLNSFCFGLRPLSNKIDSFFLTYYLRSPKMRKAVYPLAQGISRFNISKKNILKLDINIPKKTEQVAIYRSLKLIEDIIAIQQQKLTKINEIKKSLLQQMFI